MNQLIVGYLVIEFTLVDFDFLIEASKFIIKLRVLCSFPSQFDCRSNVFWQFHVRLILAPVAWPSFVIFFTGSVQLRGYLIQGHSAILRHLNNYLFFLAIILMLLACAFLGPIAHFTLLFLDEPPATRSILRSILPDLVLVDLTKVVKEWVLVLEQLPVDPGHPPRLLPQHLVLLPRARAVGGVILRLQQQLVRRFQHRTVILRRHVPVREWAATLLGDTLDVLSSGVLGVNDEMGELVVLLVRR